MKKDVRLIDLFIKTLQISLFTFGGGFVMISLMQKEFVEKLGWLDSEEMQDIMVIAQTFPGPMAVNTAVMVGYKLQGKKGIFMSALGIVLPPLIILTAVSVFYTQFKQSAAISAILQGMRAGVAAIVLDAAFSIMIPVIRKKNILHIFIMLGTFVAVGIFGINVIIVLLICCAVGCSRVILNTIRGGK